MKNIIWILLLMPIIGICQLQSSGQISIGDIRTEISATNSGAISVLRINSIGGTGPVSFSDFYGYDDSPQTLTVFPGSVLGYQSGGGTILFSVTATAGVSWNVTENESWLSVSGGSGTGNGGLSVIVSGNLGGTREGDVVVNWSGLNPIITIEQN